MEALTPLATARGAQWSSASMWTTFRDHRPGQEAAARHGARFPLVEAGFTKDEVACRLAPARAADLGQGPLPPA